MKSLLSRFSPQIKAVDTPPSLPVMEGTPYSRYAIPVDYLPSRDFKPRWGYSRPRIEALNSWFTEHTASYVTFLSEMVVSVDGLRGIPMHFSEEALPLPAWWGVPYCPFDALALYTMILKHRPRLYLEIGSGATTCFAKLAAQHTAHDMQIVSIDPEPRAEIDAICDEVIRQPLETCELSIFDRLQPGDVLFFDGSHRSFMNSDVTVFFIDVLPRLKPGVIIHIHDISLPWDYDVFFRNWYWNEQYLLAVYLMGHMKRINPLFPTAFVDKDDAFKEHRAKLPQDILQKDNGWQGGGALWFTHLAAPQT
jgi:Methyltransferase domain